MCRPSPWAACSNTQFDQVYHEHLTYWTVNSLDRLFALHGLEIFFADLLAIHGGSLELLVARRARARRSIGGQNAGREKELGDDQFENLPEIRRRVWEIEAN